MNPETEPVYSTLHCSSVYHISQLRGRGEARTFSVYDRCMALANGENKTNKSFLNLHSTLAPYLHCHENVLYASVKMLENAGWLVVESRKQGAPTTYRPVPHDEWVLTHPGLCVQTYSPDYWLQDPLGKSFYGLTGGIKIGGPNVLIGWRKLIPNDEMILIHVGKYLISNPKPHHKHEYTTWLKGFGSYLREQSC